VWRIYVSFPAVEEVECFHAVLRKVYFVPTLQILPHFLQEMRGERIVINSENAKHTPLDPDPADPKNLVPRVLTKRVH
jgi:hypothetical protein